MAKSNDKFDYTAHAVAKSDNGRTDWTRIGVGFINEKPGPEGGDPVQTVSLKLNAGLLIDTSRCDIVLLPFVAKDNAKA